MHILFHLASLEIARRYFCQARGEYQAIEASQFAVAQGQLARCKGETKEIQEQKKTAGFDAGGKNLFLRGEQMHKDILRHEDVTLMTGTVFMALSTLSSERIYIAEV